MSGPITVDCACGCGQSFHGYPGEFWSAACAGRGTPAPATKPEPATEAGRPEWTPEQWVIVRGCMKARHATTLNNSMRVVPTLCDECSAKVQAEGAAPATEEGKTDGDA